MGRMMTLSGTDRRIAGVVGDVQQLNAGWGIDDPIWAVPTIYLPAAQTSGAFLQLVHTWFQPAWVVRTSGPGLALSGEIRAAITSLDPELPIAEIAALSETVHTSLARPRFNASFLAIIAAFALVLAAVGLWGLVANEVVERGPEMGMRMALGATPGEAVRAAARPGLKLAIIGLLIGGGISALGAGVLESLITGVAPFDPLTLGGVIGMLLAVAAAASFLPALRTARLDPAATLRQE
jgi:ABC-type antimicrobial peptide transport system permease subunit